MNSNGFTVIEIVLAAALFMIISVGVVGVALQGIENGRFAQEETIATQFASEGIEAVRSIRNRGYSLLTNTSASGISSSSGFWNLSGTSNTYGKYNRVVSIASAQRDGGGNIVNSGGSGDPHAKKITSTVTWSVTPGRNNTLSITNYLTNWKRSLMGDWLLPSVEASFDFTAGNSGNAGADGISIAYADSKVYLGRNNSGGREFYIFDVSNPASPTILGQRDLDGDPNDIVIRGNYAYIASTDNVSELQILDISDPTTIADPGKLNVVDLTVANSGDNTANAIALSINGSYLLMTRDAGSKLLIFDLGTTPANPGAPIGFSVAGVPTGTPRDIASAGNYAYITSTNDTQEIWVYDITIKVAPVNLTTVNLNSGNNGANASAITMVGTTRILVGRVSSSAPELYSIDVSTPATPVLDSTLELGTAVTDIAYGSAITYAFISTADGTNDIQIVDMSNPSVLSGVAAQLNIANAPTKITYAEPSMDRLFIADSNGTEEFIVVKPQ